jgi:subtilisin
MRRAPWFLRRVGFPRAWAQVANVSATAPLRIGLLDSGLDLTHPHLRPYLGPSLNLLERGAPVWDEAGHGTAIASLIVRAARPAPLQLLPVKLLNERIEGVVGAVIRGLYWCAEQGCELINLSFGAGRQGLPALQQAVEALERAGILLVAAAGNDGVVALPGALPSVLAVGATGRDDRTDPTYARGPGLSLVAPGLGIPVERPDGGWQRASGTSLAAPLVTAAAALLLTKRPALRPATVRERLLATAERLPGLDEAEQGAGLLRVDYLLGERPLGVGRTHSMSTRPCFLTGNAPSSASSCSLTDGPPSP